MSDYLEVSRVINAPLAQVFEACKYSGQLSQWRAPGSAPISKYELEFSVGGKWILCMKMPSGHEMWLGGEYLAIAENEAITHSEYMCDASGNVLDPKDMGMNDWPKQTEVTWQFSKVDEGKTKVTLRHGKLPSSQMRDQAEQGWTQALENLDSFLGGN